MSGKTAIVTGSNKIAFAVVKGLCSKFNGLVYLTAKDEAKGKDAVKQLNLIGLHPEFYQLDIEDEESIKNFAEFIKEKHGGLDVFVNCTSILYHNAEFPTYEQAKNTIGVYYKSFLNIEEHLFPLLKNGARVVNASSACGHLSNLRNREWIDKLKNKDLTVSELNAFVDSYLKSVKDGTFDKNNFADQGKYADYRVAMIAVTLLTFIQQRKYFNKNISINVVQTGHLKTHMINKMKQEPDDAAKSILYLILKASEKLKGIFMWQDGKLIDWLDYETDYYSNFCKPNDDY